MATGDRIAIADKATLDQVKSSVDLVKSGVDTANQALNNLSLAGSDRDSYTASDLLNKLKIGIVGSSVGNSYTQMLNEEASGKLYMILLAASYGTNSSNTAYLKLTVDSQVIIDRYVSVANNASYNEYIGFLTPDAAVRTGGSRLMVMNSNLILPDNLRLTNFSSLHSASTLTMNYSPKPIRFNNGFTIQSYATVANCSIYYMYELD